MLIGSALFLGIIEFSPKNTQAFLQNLDGVKQEVVDLSQGKKTFEDSFEKVQNKVEMATKQTGPAFDNVITYAKKKVDPSLVDDSQPEFDINEIELLVHEYTNQERVKYGLTELSFDSQIADISRKHSLDMGTRNYFSHQTPEGLDPTDRADQEGYSCTKLVGIMIYSGLAENIFQGYLYESYYTVNDVITSYDWSTNEEIARITVDGWMESPGHRKNILTEMFDREGIGAVITEDDRIYITQNFC